MDKQNCFQNHIKMLKQLNFFYSQPFTLPTDSPAKLYLSETFGLSFRNNLVSHLVKGNSTAL